MFKLLKQNRIQLSKESKLRQNKGQSSSIEYATTFFLVAAVVATMTVFVKRAVQGRIRDARDFAVTYVYNSFSTNGSFNLGNLYREYEPYYADTLEEKVTDLYSSERHMGGGVGTSGIFQKNINEAVVSNLYKNERPGNYSAW